MVLGLSCLGDTLEVRRNWHWDIAALRKCHLFSPVSPPFTVFTCFYWCLLHDVLSVCMLDYDDVESPNDYRGENYFAQYKIDMDKFRTPTSYQMFPSILRMPCVKMCAPGMGCRRGFLCAACSVKVQHR